MNLQQDAIIIYSFDGDETSNEIAVSGNGIESLSIEFSNLKSTELFAVDFCKAMSGDAEQKQFAQNQLNEPSLVPMMKAEQP